MRRALLIGMANTLIVSAAMLVGVAALCIYASWWLDDLATG